MYLLERKERHKIFNGNWGSWEAQQVFNSSNSSNPRKEALQVFENLEKDENTLWRVTHNNKFVIEHRE